MTTQVLTRQKLTSRLRKPSSPKAWLAGNAGALLLLAILCASGVQAYRFCWAEQLYGHLRNGWTGDTAPGHTLWLPGFNVAVQAKIIDPDLRNLSGITYDYDRDRLLAITNGAPMELLALDNTGEILARYPLQGFTDPEGLAYLGNDRLAIANEGNHRLDIITLPSTGEAVTAAVAQSITLPVRGNARNKGIEGLTYDPANDRLIAVKERDPRQLFAVSGVMRSIQGPLGITVADMTPWVERSRYARDLSDAYFDPRTGNLLLLSDESMNITELDSQGNFVSIRSLRGGVGGLRADIPQAEGLTMDRDGNLYVVSEPNLFYQFRKP